MRTIKNRWFFLCSILAGMGIVLGLAGYFHLKDSRPAAVNQLTQDIAVTEQIKQEAMGQLKERGFATVIDLRPDGEAVDQPTSAAMSAAAKANSIKFYYVPVPHGEIPQQSVAQLAEALRNAPKPVLMYCRSGKRAARTWSLAEASRAGGMDANSIMAAVKQGGQSADDLEPDIIRRISERAATSGEKR